MSEFSFKADRPVGSYGRSDIFFIISVLLLWGLGIFTLYVCTPYTAERLFGDRYYFVTRQLVWSGIGFALMVFFAVVKMSVIQKMLPFIVMGTLFLCLLAFIPGIGSNRKGASRWIYIAGLFTLQPSEFAKFAVVLFLANLFQKQRREGRSDFYYPLAGLFVFVAIIFVQRDFSTGVFIFLVGCMMFFVCGARMTWFLPLLLLALPAIALMVSIEPYRLNRVIAFLHPEEFAMTSGYQEMASKRAITAGGFWGNGVGEGLTEVFKIPELHADYIFAGWADSMGLFGVTAYFALLLFFAWRGTLISLNCGNAFAAYASFGCVCMVFMQSLLNCAVVCGAAPTTGMPLPFFSSGGSSLVVSFCMCGFVINASHAPPDDEGGGMSVLGI
ncbi:MAG: FtsW/RodA/SpoVE family cell cycle protein [Treponema sp.]|nr:FtsW/RodA/SpoVE family cell cycle protein [Treponema sp.]MBQ7167607.1 FtsW/RodA/SpoVE family cell cycle protein [Treponema sp.]